MTDQIPININEPTLPDLIKRGILFVPTAGMREAPEKLLTELFREVFFEKFADSRREQQLDPLHQDENRHSLFSLGEQAALYATRGRKKKTNRSKVKVFYGAPYPALARHAWPRAKSDRVLRDHFLAGPLAQWFQGCKDREIAMRRSAEQYVDAFIGGRSAVEDAQQGKEILSAISRNQDISFSREQCVSRLVDHFSDNVESYLAFDAEDPLAQRIKMDFDSICQIEKHVSRIQWLDILKCFLRLSLSSWLLSQMKMTVILRGWAVKALDEGLVPSQEEILEKFKFRYRELFHPTLTPTDETTRHVEHYMRARIELNILLYITAKHLPEGFLKKQLVTINKGANKLTIGELLENLTSVRKKVSGDNALSSVAQLAIRQAETHAAWTAPLRCGMGKNFDEFLLVLRRGAEGDSDDGYLLTPTKSGGLVVFPGPMLLKTVVLLADRHQMAKARNRGKLVLSDIEDHFREYGVEFGSTTGARPRLIAELGELGLLKGSPDAGNSAEVSAPFVLPEAVA